MPSRNILDATDRHDAADAGQSLSPPGIMPVDSGVNTTEEAG
jgi:hypothetical protein